MHTKRHIFNYSQLTAARTLRAAALVLSASVLVVGPAVAPASAQVGLGLAPMRVEVNVTPGATRAGSLAVSNSVAAETRYRTEILDFALDQEATPQFEADLPAESKFSCRQWLTFNPMEGAIAGEGNATIRYTFHVPADATPRTYHCAVGFTSLPPLRKPQDTPIGMISAVRVVSVFYLTVGEPKPDGELKSIVLEKITDPETSGLRAVFEVQNNGLTNLRGLGKVELLDSNGKILETDDFPTSVILPSRTQRIPLPLKNKLTDGAYKLRARVNIGTGEIQEASIDFRPPTADPAPSPAAKPASGPMAHNATPNGPAVALTASH